MHSAPVGQPIQVPEETSQRQGESSDRRKADDLRDYTRDYGSINRPRVDAVLSNPDYGVEDTDPEGEEALYDSEMPPTMTSASFQRLIRLYGLVPITAVFTILFFTLIRHILWPGPGGPPSPFAPHLGLAILGAAVWIVSFALRVPIYLLSSLICDPMRTFTPLVSASLQVFVEESLRLSSLLLMHLRTRDNSSLSPDDPAFSRVWTLALGWAAAEVAVSVHQGYEQLLLYSDLTTPDDPAWSHHRRLDSIEGQFFHDPEVILNEDIDLVVRIRARTELEALYGIPVPDIPVFVSCLLRIVSITLSIALFLVISSSYLSYLSQSPPAEQYILQAIRRTIPTFLVILLLRTILSFSWTLNVLPRIGFHAASYMSCMFALGALFVGLGRWDAV